MVIYLSESMVRLSFKGYIPWLLSGAGNQGISSQVIDLFLEKHQS